MSETPIADCVEKLKARIAELEADFESEQDMRIENEDAYRTEFRRAQALEAQNKELREALEAHHKWQCEAEGLFMFYFNPDTERLECCDISGEYGDGSLYETTVAALSNEGPK